MTAIRHTPLEHLHGAMRAAGRDTRGAVDLSERAPRSQFDLRLDASGVPAADRALGVALPMAPGTWSGSDPTLLRLGPDEWLMLTADLRWSEERLREALVETRAVVVDVSDQRTVLRLSGPAARDVLAGGCAIDLHPAVFAPGSSAQTTVAKAHAIVVAIDDDPTYELLVGRSFAPYLATWLLDAMTEHAVT